MAISSLWRHLSICGKLYLANMRRNVVDKQQIINFLLRHVQTRCRNKTSQLPKINNYATFFVTLTASSNYLEFTVAVSMKPPWLGETQSGDTETNAKYGKYSFGVLYIMSKAPIEKFVLLKRSLFIHNWKFNNRIRCQNAICLGWTLH